MLKIFFKRLFRGIRFIPIFIKQSVFEPGESCIICGRTYKIIYNCDNKLWEMVNNKKSDVCLCPLCIVDKCETLKLNIIIGNQIDERKKMH